MIILVTAESACILIAETVILLFYQYSLFLSITLALLIGTSTLVAIESYKKMKSKMEDCIAIVAIPNLYFSNLNKTKFVIINIY